MENNNIINGLYKYIDIIFITSSYFILSLVFAIIINKIFIHIEGHDIAHIGTMELLLLTIIQLVLSTFAINISETIVRNIHNFFTNIPENDISEDIEIELQGGITLSFVMLLVQKSLRNKIFELGHRLSHL